MNGQRINKKTRNLPHWTLDGSVYFITFRLAQGSLSHEERSIVLQHLGSGDQQFYILAAAVVMPDHVHLLLKPILPYDLSRIMKGIKGVSARKINVHRKSSGTIWQDESWDRIVRDAGEFDEKLQYMADNPVEAELVRQIEDYPYWYCDKELL